MIQKSIEVPKDELLLNFITNQMTTINTIVF